MGEQNIVDSFDNIPNYNNAPTFDELEKESRHLGLGGYGLGGYGYLQIIYSIRILYLRLIYLSNILRLSCGYGCGLGLGGLGGGFGNYFHGHGGHWRSDSDD